MTARLVTHSPLIGVVGWKKSGKTTLVTRLVSELTRRGLRVATVKHAHHAIGIDDGETDSARHRRAGASQVAIVSPVRAAFIHEFGDAREPPLEEVVARLSPCDLILVEGYKSAAIPKIEVRRAAAHSRVPLHGDDSNVMAIAADYEVPPAPIPVFALDDIGGLTALVLDRLRRTCSSPT